MFVVRGGLVEVVVVYLRKVEEGRERVRRSGCAFIVNSGVWNPHMVFEVLYFVTGRHSLSSYLGMQELLLGYLIHDKPAAKIGYYPSQNAIHSSLPLSILQISV